ncbi:MAG: DinB family protein [Thermoplasmata archaeon]
MARRLDLSPNDALAMVEYNRAVFERYARRVRKLPAKAAMRDRGIGHGSLFDTLVHILNVQEVWIVHIIRGRGTEKELGVVFEDASRHPKTWKDFEAYAKRVWGQIEETTRGLTRSSIGRKVKVFWMAGSYTVRDAFFQTTMEEAHHLGEIIGALWQDDLRPPEMTWIDSRRMMRPGTLRRSG